ncbi:MAG: hypothetical protein P8M70_04060, partial [Verrucomicrobiota bacterium]|nr:hypothetical protein [Verrucomicrobiota bacterium]
MKTKERPPRARKARSVSKPHSKRGKLKRSADRFEARTASKPESKRPPGRPRGEFGMLIPELQRAIAANGYSDPTPIQAECIPHL